jgi:hypothetical protein
MLPRPRLSIDPTLGKLGSQSDPHLSCRSFVPWCGDVSRYQRNIGRIGGGKLLPDKVSCRSQ